MAIVNGLYIMKTSILVYLLFLGIKFSHIYGYRDGARSNSCFNHTVDHGPDTFLRDCNPSSCRYFLKIKEVVNDGTLELGNETEYYECGKLYGVEVANTLNPPEGFLVQARSGPEDSSDIIGTFLDPIVIEERNPSIPRNYKILECQRHQNASPELYPNSATHPFTVNSAGMLQLFWKAPNCTEETLPNVTMWYTIMQQLHIGFRPAKHITLTYRPPPPIPTSSAVISSLLPTSTYQQAISTYRQVISTYQQALSTYQQATGDYQQPMPTPMGAPITKQMQTTTTKQDILSQEQIIGLAGGGAAGLLVLIIVIIIVVVIGILLAGSSKKKKKQPSRMSMLWAAGNEPPSTFESNGKYIDSVVDSEPLTSKEHKEHDFKLTNGGNAEDNSIVA